MHSSIYSLKDILMRILLSIVGISCLGEDQFKTTMTKLLANDSMAVDLVRAAIEHPCNDGNIEADMFDFTTRFVTSDFPVLQYLLDVPGLLSMESHTQIERLLCSGKRYNCIVYF